MIQAFSLVNLDKIFRRHQNGLQAYIWVNCPQWRFPRMGVPPFIIPSTCSHFPWSQPPMSVWGSPHIAMVSQPLNGMILHEPWFSMDSQRFFHDFLHRSTTIFRPSEFVPSGNRRSGCGGGRGGSHCAGGCGCGGLGSCFHHGTGEELKVWENKSWSASWLVQLKPTMG